MEVLQHVWTLGNATVAEVHACIQKSRPLAYTTVMTVMKNLTEKGFLRCDRSSSTYTYSAKQSAEQVRSGIISDLVRKVFSGSPTALIQTLVANENLSLAEVEQIRELIDSLGEADE